MIGIILLFIILLLLGLAITSLFNLKLEGNDIDNWFIGIGLGIGVFIILSVVLSLLHIPLSWITYSIIAIPLLILVKLRYSFSGLKIYKKQFLSIIVLCLFIIQALILINGAFKYQWLEDGDPWHHATITKYISEQKTMFEPVGKPDLLKYADPYPPSYDVLMSVAYQREGQLIPTLKIINALLVALCIPLSYLFFKRLFSNDLTAFFASAILFFTPCFLSHFIWSITLAIVVFFPLMYSLEKIQEDKKWVYIAIIMVAALLISQPSMALKLSIMVLLYTLAKMIIHRNWQKYLVIAGICGVALSFLWWGTAIVRWGPPSNGWNGIYNPAGNAETGKHLAENPGWFRNKGTADRIYTWKDFMFANVPNMINNPIGLGYILACLLIFAVFYLIADFKNLFHEDWRLISLFWLVFTFLGIHGARLPVQFIAFRFWMLFAIPCSVLVAGAIVMIATKYGVSKYALIGLVLVGIAVTSGLPKYQINTAIWPSGGLWSNSGELADYLAISDYIPPDAKVFPFCAYGTDKVISVGFDTCAWCKDEHEFRYSFMNQTIGEIHTFLKEKGYEYAALDGRCVSWYSPEAVNQKTTDLLMSGKFMVANEPRGMMLLKVIN